MSLNQAPKRVKISGYYYTNYDPEFEKLNVRNWLDAEVKTSLTPNIYNFE